MCGQENIWGVGGGCAGTPCALIRRRACAEAPKSKLGLAARARAERMTLAADRRFAAQRSCSPPPSCDGESNGLGVSNEVGAAADDDAATARARVVRVCAAACGWVTGVYGRLRATQWIG